MKKEKTKYKHFPIMRLGNKWNDIKYFDKYLVIDIKTIVEPFGGTFAVTRHSYYGDQYKRHLNDNDDILIDSLKWICNHLDEWEGIKQEWNKMQDIKAKKAEFKNESTELLSAWKIPPYVKISIKNGWWTRGIVKKQPSTVDYSHLKKMIDASCVTCLDYKEVFDKHKDDKDVLVFLDPPYLDSDNTQYAVHSKKNETKIIKDNTGMYIDIKEFIETAKCKVLFICNSNELIRYLFKDYVRGEYDKIYQLTKKKSIHVIISNYEV